MLRKTLLAELMRSARIARISVIIALAAPVVLAAAPAFAQTPAGDKPAAESREAAGDSARPEGPGTEHHAGEAQSQSEEEQDPTEHFNYVGIQPGHVFDYIGKDEYGGKFGDGTETTKKGQVLHEEEPASPPFIFMLFNFALLLGILAWKLLPVGNQVAAQRHDLIKNALDEAAKLRKQAADKLAEYETRLSTADAEIKQLVDSIRTGAERERADILAQAETQAAQTKRDAELRIAAEIETARAELTREVVAAAAAVSEKLLREKLTSADQHQLVGSFIADVQRGAARTGTGKGDVR